MHTTKQAKTLWCPMARVARREETIPKSEIYVVVGGLNRDALGSPAGFVLNSCKCVADQCAMWRWASEDATQARVIAKERLALDESSAGERPAGCDGWEFQPCNPFKRTPAQWVQPQSQADANRTGYCGLAGHPVTL